MCRSFLSDWVNENGQKQFDGRCNMGVVSINLPRIGLELKSSDISERIDEYMTRLEEVAEIAHKALQTRIKRISMAQAKVAPICWQYGALGRLAPNDYIINHLKDGYASISLGYVGMNEAINAIFKVEQNDLTNSKQQKELSIRILKFLYDKCNLWKNDEGFAYGMYGTPAESLAGKFVTIDKKKFGIIKGVTDKEYYTNSFHLDVMKKVNPFDKIDFEKEYLKYTPNGNITYVEMPNMKDNIQALEKVIDYAYDNVMYFGINSPIDACSCGWRGEATWNGEQFECPACKTSDGRDLHVLRRICGYLGEINQRPANKGKLDEFSKRIKHC